MDPMSTALYYNLRTVWGCVCVRWSLRRLLAVACSGCARHGSEAGHGDVDGAFMLSLHWTSFLGVLKEKSRSSGRGYLQVMSGMILYAKAQRSSESGTTG